MGFILHACYGVFGQKRGIGGPRNQSSVWASLNFFVNSPIEMIIESLRASISLEKSYIGKFPGSDKTRSTGWVRRCKSLLL